MLNFYYFVCLTEKPKTPEIPLLYTNNVIYGLFFNRSHSFKEAKICYQCQLANNSCRNSSLCSSVFRVLVKMNYGNRRKPLLTTSFNINMCNIPQALRFYHYLCSLWEPEPVCWLCHADEAQKSQQFVLTAFTISHVIYIKTSFVLKLLIRSSEGSQPAQG